MLQRVYSNFITLLVIFFLTSQWGYAQNLLGQTLQINTHLNSITAKPTWLLIIRDMQTGIIIPYIFDIRNNDNYWIAFSYGHSYQITASSLKFGPRAIINNFCDLQDGVISGQSMFITLTGDLTPDVHSSKCHVLQYNDTRQQ